MRTEPFTRKLSFYNQFFLPFDNDLHDSVLEVGHAVSVAELLLEIKFDERDMSKREECCLKMQVLTDISQQRIIHAHFTSPLLPQIAREKQCISGTQEPKWYLDPRNASQL